MTEPLEPAYDPVTLRETYPDPDAVQRRITELRRTIGTALDDIAELMDRGELVELLGAADALDDALSQATLAVDRAELVGTPAQQHTARIRLARVRQWRGEFVEADLLFIELLAAAPGFGPVIEAFTRQHSGENDYEQGRYGPAAEQFAAALELRRAHQLPEEQIASSELALAAARARQEESR